MSEPKYLSDVVLGDRYRDSDTSFEGVANAITFYRNGCERVQLRAMVSNIPAEHWFDAPRLEHIPDARVVGFGAQKNGVTAPA